MATNSTYLTNEIQFECQTNPFEEDFIRGELFYNGQFVKFRKCHLKTVSDSNSKNEFAVKIIKKRSIQLINHVFVEVTILRTLQHPNIIQLHSIYESKINFRLVMEYFPRGSLIDNLIEKEYYSEEDAKCLSTQLVTALSYIHENLIVHQDIKLDNVLITSMDSLQIKIIDFGLARIVTSMNDYFVSDVGTTQYIPPEVCLGEPTSAARDMWSAGICIYLLLSGYFPFPDTTQEEFIRQVCKSEFTSELDSLPPNAILLITRLLQRDPVSRLTAKEALEHPWFHQVTNSEDQRRLGIRKKWKKSITAVRASRAFLRPILAKNLLPDMADIDDENMSD